MLKEILFAISASSIAMALLAFLARSIVAHFLSKDIEAYKAKLEADSSVEIEKLRNCLNQVAYEHQVVFSHLHEKRMDVILELHSELVDIKNAVEKLVSRFQGPDFHQVRHENATNAATRAAEFYNLFEKRKLFLDEKLAAEMDAFVTKLYQFVLKFNMEMNLATSPDLSAKYGTELRVWTESWQSFEKEFVPILRSLESQFRILLGSEVKKTTLAP